MLTIPIETITILLDQAVDVDVGLDDDMAETAVDDGSPAYRALASTLGELTPAEIYQLLAVAVIGDSDNAVDAWAPALEHAQSVAAEGAVDEVVRILVLTDAIENGLELLGYEVDFGERADDAAEEVDEADESEPEA